MGDISRNWIAVSCQPVMKVADGLIDPVQIVAGYERTKGIWGEMP